MEDVVASYLSTEPLRMQVPDCAVCWDKFDSNKRIPRLLNCGHTICQTCLEFLPTENRCGQVCKRCPECRCPCIWKGANELPKNYILLRAMDVFAESDGSRQSLTNLALNILSDMHLSLPIPSFVWAEISWSQRLLKQKLWEVVKLTGIAGLVFLFVPMSLVPVLLAWGTATIGFLTFLWLSVAGIGFCVFVLIVWCSCRVFMSFLKSYKSIFKSAAMIFKVLASLCHPSWIKIGWFDHK